MAARFAFGPKEWMDVEFSVVHLTQHERITLPLDKADGFTSPKREKAVNVSVQRERWAGQTLTQVVAKVTKILYSNLDGKCIKPQQTGLVVVMGKFCTMHYAHPCLESPLQFFCIMIVTKA